MRLACITVYEWASPQFLYPPSPQNEEGTVKPCPCAGSPAFTPDPQMTTAEDGNRIPEFCLLWQMPSPSSLTLQTPVSEASRLNHVVCPSLLIHPQTVSKANSFSGQLVPESTLRLWARLIPSQDTLFLNASHCALLECPSLGSSGESEASASEAFLYLLINYASSNRILVSLGDGISPPS